MTETDTTAEILVAITNIPGVFAYRQNSGLFMTRTGARVRASVLGASDIIAVYGGRFFALEVKTSGGKQSLHQKTYQRAVERAGGIYAIVRSAADAVAVITAIP